VTRWRAIEEYDVVVLVHSRYQLIKPTGPLLHVVEFKIHVAVREIGGQ